MALVNWLAVASGGLIALGFVWIACVKAAINTRAEGEMVATTLALPGFAALCIGVLLAVVNALVAVQP